MLAALHADFLKIKRKWFWLLVFLGPFGVIALQMVNYGVRYDYLVQGSTDVWQDLLMNVNGFVTLALLLGISILASQIASIEHQQNSWKHLLSLPIKRRVVFSSKFFILLFMLFLSCILLFIGTILLGIGLGFSPSSMPLFDIFKNSFYPLLAGLPILALQTWLSITIDNQAIPLTIGIFGTIAPNFARNIPEWFIWKWPTLTGDNEPMWYVIAGLMLGAVILLIGVIDFEKRDVK
ncbi:ABC transporter permease [Metabacillus malikii]|uniref:Permease n=1 Tax=Metabacillus malikii TaxID=1504265 RepID=A0ABT9ZJI5_9BACI|nr:ABC transporter permease [Metabacillus malikii]MDQ0231395.1 hypothetical protein [Metabacillus malikii]